MTGGNNEHPPSEQRLYTESEIIQLFNKLRLEEKQATEALYETHDLPLEITESCEGLSRQDSIEFARKFKKKQPKFYYENITIGEQLNKNYIHKCKNHKTETIKSINTLYKISENTRAADRGATDIFARLKFIKENQGDLDQVMFNNLIDEALEITHNLSVFSWTEAKLQDDEAGEFAIDALYLPNSIKHLGSTNDNGNKRDAFDAEFVQAYNEATYQRSIISAATTSLNTFRGGNRGRGFFHGRGNFNRHGRGNFWNRGRGGGPSGSYSTNSYCYVLVK